MRTALELLLAVSMLSCATPPRLAPTWDPTAIPTVQAIPAPPRVLAASLDSAPEPLSRGRYVVLHGRSACNAALGRGNPLVWPDMSSLPRVGVPMRVDWTSTPTEPYLDVEPVILLMSFGRRDPVRVDHLGLPGCLRWVDDPPNLFAFTPRSSPEWLYQSGGTVHLTWTPPPAFSGVRIVMQLVVMSRDSNDAGWLLSPGLEAWIAPPRL